LAITRIAQRLQLESDSLLSSHDYFELRRMSDGLVYQFDRKQLADGQVAYKRRDQDLWITFNAQCRRSPCRPVNPLHPPIDERAAGCYNHPGALERRLSYPLGKSYD
jgi:hypothetical protein